MFPLLFGFSHSVIAGGFITIIPEELELPEDDDALPALLMYLSFYYD